MKQIKLKLLMLLLCVGSYSHSQESWNYVNNSDTSFAGTLYRIKYTENSTAFACGSQGKILYKESLTVSLKPLYEMFTSSTCDPCVAANDILTEILDANQDEYSLIKYQMDWPGAGDPYYTQEGGTRRNYYGVNFVPDLYINSEQLEPASSLTQEIFEQYADMLTSMEIEITEAFIDEENVISINAEITPLANYAAGLNAHIVVVEKRTFNNIGTNGETEFHNVMMKMLPDASGTELEALNIGDLTTLNETYDMDDTYMETPDDLAVVVFVQNNADKSIVQSAMVDVGGSFESYNISYIVEDVNANPIEGAAVLLENYGTLISDESGQVVFEAVLVETYNYSVNYAGLIPHSNTINVIDEDITQVIVLEHYTSLSETFNSGIPSSWTKHVASSNYLYSYSGKVKFARFSGDDGALMLISPAVEVHPTDTLSYEFGEAENNPTMSFGIISDPYDPSTYIELGVHYPGDEWESYELPINSLSTSDTVIYFAWNLIYPNVSSFHLDNVLLNKIDEFCLPIYTQGCSNFGMGFTDFALEQIENYNSGCADLNNTGWSQYLELGPAELLAGETYSITVSSGYENNYASFWIDYNNDFMLSADEMAIDNFLMEQPGILYEVELHIPAGTADGIYFMRARTNGDGLCNDPCGEYYYGEAEDYMIQVGEELILPPSNLSYELTGSDLALEWDAPILDELIGYNVYYAHEAGAFDVLVNVDETTFTHESPEFGLHQYYVTAVYDAGESDPTNTVEVLITGIQRQFDNGFQLYPNPACGNEIMLKTDYPKKISEVKILSLSGQLFVSESNISYSDKLDISILIEGMYLVQVIFKDGSSLVEKIIVN